MISASHEDLMMIACKAIAYHQAKIKTKEAKQHYHIAWQCYETGQDKLMDEEMDISIFVHPEERIFKNHPDFDAACLATEKQHKAYKLAKREEYNAKRRLESAIRRSL